MKTFGLLLLVATLLVFVGWVLWQVFVALYWVSVVALLGVGAWLLFSPKPAAKPK